MLLQILFFNRHSCQLFFFRISIVIPGYLQRTLQPNISLLCFVLLGFWVFVLFLFVVVFSFLTKLFSGVWDIHFFAFKEKYNEEYHLEFLLCSSFFFMRRSKNVENMRVKTIYLHFMLQKSLHNLVIEKN